MAAAAAAAAARIETRQVRSKRLLKDLTTAAKPPPFVCGRGGNLLLASASIAGASPLYVAGQQEGFVGDRVPILLLSPTGTVCGRKVLQCPSPVVVLGIFQFFRFSVIPVKNRCRLTCLGLSPRAQAFERLTRECGYYVAKSKEFDRFTVLSFGKANIKIHLSQACITPKQNLIAFVWILQEKLSEK